MGLSEIQALKKLDPKQVYKGQEPTQRIKAMLLPKEKKAIAKVSKKAKEKQQEEKELAAQDKAFYREIWDASPHVCFECGCKLPKEPQTVFFHHALAKQSYPGFRHTHENIIILCPKDHNQAESDLSKTPKTKKRTAEILRLLLK